MTQSVYAKTVGDWIQAQRKSLNLSQAEVASVVGVSRTSLCKWESGDVVLSSYSHAKLRAYFKQQRSMRAADPGAEGKICE
jgi:transcriptional regulator with XRE-family HTH domain